MIAQVTTERRAGQADLACMSLAHCPAPAVVNLEIRSFPTGVTMEDGRRIFEVTTEVPRLRRHTNEEIGDSHLQKRWVHRYITQALFKRERPTYTPKANLHLWVFGVCSRYR